MDSYEYLMAAWMREETVELFAQKTPGVTAQIREAVHDGIKGIRKFYVGVSTYDHESPYEGLLFARGHNTPIIEVAGDGKTAKGVWISPGFETHRTGPRGRGGELLAQWCWNKYGVDFVKEDGNWKFWHFRMYGLMKADYGKSWAADMASTLRRPDWPDELKPERWDTNVWKYSPTAVTRNEPAIPKPYKTWDESMSYVK